MLKHLSDLKKRLPAEPKKLVLAAAQDHHAMEAVFKAKNENIIEPILVGPIDEIKKTAEDLKIDLSQITIHHAENTLGTVHKAVSLISSGEADILMKGRLQTPEILKGVLNKEWGLSLGKKLSHVALFEAARYHKLFAVTDVAMNSAPDLDDKRLILDNAVTFMHSIGVENPKVAVLAAIEKINPKQVATLDAKTLMEENEAGKITGCTLIGPIAFDGAMSKVVALDKGIQHDAAGDADILLAPNIEAGNILYKCLNLFAEVKVAAIIVGAKAPIVLTSRSDSEEAKFNSILLAASTCS